jgi:hypothetical protein
LRPVRSAQQHHRRDWAGWMHTHIHLPHPPAQPLAS